MTRSKRLQPVKQLAVQAERAAAVRVGELRQRLEAAQQREQELQHYCEEYQRSFAARGSEGADVHSLRQYQAFVAKLSAAVKAQQAHCAQLREQCERERGRLQIAMQRRQALGKVMDKARHEENRMLERQTQRDLDEMAGRPMVRP